MRGGVFSKNIWEGASERRNENIIVSGTLKIDDLNRIADYYKIAVNDTITKAKQVYDFVNS